MEDKVHMIYERLRSEYPDVHCELNFQTPLQLLTATVLSAQTTDRQVNKVTERLFGDCPELEDLLKLSVEELEEYIHSIGFYHTKARNLYQLFRQLADRFGGEVPKTMEELTSLPGVGRKSGYVQCIRNSGHRCGYPCFSGIQPRWTGSREKCRRNGKTAAAGSGSSGMVIDASSADLPWQALLYGKKPSVRTLCSGWLL